jgi:hypothetical protein
MILIQSGPAQLKLEEIRARRRRFRKTALSRIGSITFGQHRKSNTAPGLTFFAGFCTGCPENLMILNSKVRHSPSEHVLQQQQEHPEP